MQQMCLCYTGIKRSPGMCKWNEARATKWHCPLKRLLEMKAQCGLHTPAPSNLSTSPPSPYPPPVTPNLPTLGLDVHCEAASIQSRSSHTGFSMPSLTCPLGCLSQQSEGRLCITDQFGGRPFTTRQHRASDQQTLTPEHARTHTQAHKKNIRQQEKRDDCAKF